MIIKKYLEENGTLDDTKGYYVMVCENFPYPRDEIKKLKEHFKEYQKYRNHWLESLKSENKI